MSSTVKYGNQQIVEVPDDKTAVLKTANTSLLQDITIASSSSTIVYAGYVRKLSTSGMYNSGVELTVEKAGTYKVSWFVYADNYMYSSQVATQIFIDDSPYGSPVYGSNWVISTYRCGAIVVEDVTIRAGQKISVYVSVGGSGYYVSAGQLVLEKTA